MIHEQIKSEVKQALKEKNEVKLLVVRNILSAFTNELVAKKQKPDEMLADADALGVIKRLAKQRQDAIEQFTQGGRPELAEAEQKELAFLKTYLPPTLSREEIKKVAVAKQAELGATKKESGQLMAALMREFKGQADGADVKAVVDEILQ